MATCGICDCSFDSEHGVKIHKSMAHGPPERECENCQDNFRIPPDNKDKKFCSKECYVSHGRVKTNCHSCNKKISVRKSRFERNNRIFCSEDCVNFKGEENPFFGKTHENLSEKMPSGKNHWMYGKDRPEHSKRMSEQHSGKNNPMYGVRGEDAPNWQGGEQMAQDWRRSAEWYEARRTTLDRDNHMCQDCEKSEDLHVHHIEPVSMGGDKFDTENLITLCSEHHYMRHTK